MEIGPGDPDLGRPCSSHLRADRRCSGEPAARMARSGLHPGRIRRDYRAGPHARSAFADWRILAGTVGRIGRRAHHWIGGALVVAVVIHVGGLWITSPPDMIDALLFASPTPFSPFGVIAMWAIFAVALLAALRRRLGLRPRTWRIAHMLLAIVIVVGSVVHGILIEGTMETVSKAALCALVLAATIKVMADLRVWRKRGTLRGESIARQ